MWHIVSAEARHHLCCPPKTLKDKFKVVDDCVDICCWDIWPPEVLSSRRFVKVAQTEISTWARVSKLRKTTEYSFW